MLEKSLKKNDYFRLDNLYLFFLEPQLPVKPEALGYLHIIRDMAVIFNNDLIIFCLIKKLPAFLLAVDIEATG